MMMLTVKVIPGQVTQTRAPKLSVIWDRSQAPTPKHCDNGCLSMYGCTGPLPVMKQASCTIETILSKKKQIQ